MHKTQKNHPLQLHQDRVSSRWHPHHH
jgi:hypothetical protein